MSTVRIIGPGRVGRSLAIALRGAPAAAGWLVVPSLGRGEDLRGAAAGVDLLVIATPDDVIAEIAATVATVPATVVAHCSGALGLDALAPHGRRASAHPLASITDAESGARRLAAACSFAVDGDPLVEALVAALGGRVFRVPPDERVHYHAAAAIAANHLVALLGQVERVSAGTGVPLGAYLDLAAETLENVRRLGPAAALTGPAARGDRAVVARHLAALAPDERPAYEALADQAARLALRQPLRTGGVN